MGIITKSDVLNSRDIIRRYLALKEERDMLIGEEIDQWDYLHGDEFGNLECLNEEGKELIPGWSSGVSLIRQDHFADYLKRKYGEQIPVFIVVDWDATAEEMMQNFTFLFFGNTVYIART